MLFGRLALFVLAFGLVAGAELFREGPLPTWLGLVLAFGFGGAFGLLTVLVFALSRRALSTFGLLALAERTFLPDGEDPGEAARFHARTWVRVFGITLLLVTMALLARRLSGLQDAELARRLSLFAVLCALLAWPLASRPLERAFAKVLAHAGPNIREPAWAFGLAVTPVALTAGAFSLIVFLKHGETLGMIGLLLLLAVGVSLSALLSVAIAQNARRKLAPFFLLLWLMALLVGFIPSEALRRARNELASSIAARSVLELLRALSDVDRDGHAAWLDGGDCSPFEATRHPDAREVARDGKDSDCDGKDDPVGLKVSSDTYTLAKLSPAEVRPYNVILIVIDSLRADHVTALGYSRKTTPNLDRLAQRGWLFAQSHSQASATQVSFPAFFTGYNPISLEWERRGHLQISHRHKTLAELLSARGYHTGFFFNGWIEEHMQGVMRGFRVREDVWPDRNDWQKWRQSSSASTLGRGIHFIESAREKSATKPFFLTLYFEDPHAPYEAYSRADVPSFGRTEIDHYDQEIAFADRHVGVLLDYLRYRPELEKNTILIVTADHGEEFREHGGQHHGHNCNVESTHVPLIVSIPGETPRVSKAPVGLVDIVPTVLERVGVDPSPLRLDGRSLRWAFEASPAEIKQRALFCTVFDDRNVRATLLHAVRRDGLLLTQHQATRVVRLYDSREDPQELVDVAADPGLLPLKKELEALLESKKRFVIPP